MCRVLTSQDLSRPVLETAAGACARMDLVGKWACPTDARYLVPHLCHSPSCKIDIQVDNYMFYLIVKAPTPILNVMQHYQSSDGLNLRKLEISARMAE